MIWKTSKTAAQAAPATPDYDPTAPDAQWASEGANKNSPANDKLAAMPALNVTPIAAVPSQPPTARATGPGGPGNGGAGSGGQGGGMGSGGSGGAAGPPKGPFSHAPPEGHARKVSEVLGEIVWLMSQSPLHKQFFISGLELPFADAKNAKDFADAKNDNELMTPVLLQQFRLFYATGRPIGVMRQRASKKLLWGMVSEEVEQRLAGGVGKLRPQDWKSGDKLWVMLEACFQHDEVIAPFGGAEEMVKDLKEKVFPDRAINFVAVTKDGKKETRVV